MKSSRVLIVLLLFTSELSLSVNSKKSPGKESVINYKYGKRRYHALVCDESQTLCADRKGRYRCCGTEEASCCEGGESCCPKDYYCSFKTKSCCKMPTAFVLRKTEVTPDCSMNWMKTKIPKKE
ncbi:probable cysteine protease RD21B [Galendromus occidentalis]|uniref:Probable cysteine protease RD21B n=1 Tax=Galendromus occidentalis TaxID=34638 RepID=A0AAJ6QWM8_9ACAR|nr:probable cysteine protease RD21B [Galendromus occidentalis]